MSIPPCSMAVLNLMRRKAARFVDWLLLVTCVSFGELSLTFLAEVGRVSRWKDSCCILPNRHGGVGSKPKVTHE